jgi:creatinine amidohydrolase
MDIERYLQRDNRIILVLGATEQHAYLSVMTDVLITNQIAQAVAQRTGILIAPSLPFGISGQFSDFPGTISLSQLTFDAVVMEVIESLLHQGFRRFLIINGHDSNRPPQRLRDLEMDGLLRVAWFDWWHSAAARHHEDTYGLRIDHANWSENYAFTRIHECPSEPKPLVNLDVDSISLRDSLGDGSFGGLYEVAPEVMQTLLTGLEDEATRLLLAL